MYVLKNVGLRSLYNMNMIHYNEIQKGKVKGVKNVTS